jgi:predicted dehydrogenase
MSDPVRIGVIGLGFAGRTHVRAIQSARRDGLPVVLAALADLNPTARRPDPAPAGNLGLATGSEPLFDPSTARLFERAEDLLDCPGLDAVVIASPTDTHAPLAARALERGLHVLVEKPVALTTAEVAALAHAEARSRGRIVPGFVIRSWPEWVLLRECIRDHRFGPLHALHLTRVGCRPQWSEAYRDDARCGGAILDLHIHDADFVLHVLGPVREVLAVGTPNYLGAVYRFTESSHKTVTAVGGWLASQGRAFRMRFQAEFELATIEFDLASTPTVVITRNGESSTPPLPKLSAFDLQMHSFIQCVRAWQCGQPICPVATLDDALAASRLIDAERRSLETGTWETP